MAYGGNEAKIPLGELGILTDVASDKTPPNALIWAKNIVFTNGTVQKAPGTVKWNASPLDSGIVAVHDWWPNTVTQRMVAATSAGFLYKGRDRQFGTALNSTSMGLLTPNCMFVEGGQEVAGNPKKLFLFTAGVKNPYVLNADGTSFAVIGQPAADWTGTNLPKCGVVHRNRMWAFAGQLGYASNSSDHENFVSGYLSDAIYPGEGGEILGAYVYKGRLIVFKDGGFVYWLNDQDSDDDNWFWQKLGSNFGLSAPNGIAEVIDSLYAGNVTGTITEYSAAQTLGDLTAADLIKNCQFENFLRATTSKVGVTEQHMLYYPEKKQLFATYRSAYYTYNDMLLVFDFARTGSVRTSYWIKGYPNCLSLYKDASKIQRPMYGDKDGYVHLMDAEDRLEGATAYVGDFQTPHLDFSHLDPKMSTVQKHFDFLAVHYIPEGNWNLSCDYFIDGKFIETINFAMIQYDDNKLNVLTLNTDRLAQRNSETVIRKLRGSGRTFSARFYNSGSNQSFQIPAITVGFRGGAEEAQKAE